MTINPTQDAMRESFEANYKKDGCPSLLKRWKDGYFVDSVQMCWELWQAAHQSREAEVRGLREDAARLDHLDKLNANLNRISDSKYGWKIDTNHNRVMVSDCHFPPQSIRETIDAHMAQCARQALTPVKDSDNGK